MPATADKTSRLDSTTALVGIRRIDVADVDAKRARKSFGTPAPGHIPGTRQPRQ
jgi:hypothetical protein